MAQAADTSLMEAGWIGAQTRGGCRRRCGHTRGVDGGRAGGQRTGFRGLVGYEGMDALGTWACQRVIARPQACSPLRAREGRA